ncbi:MAG: 2-amino-4-hydroxy-6-hydroxymethyldihydropteridine diphosphokinase [Candidatus Zhuqueibacterota bacterium]
MGALGIYLGVGTNQGDRIENLKHCIHLLLATGLISVEKISSVYESEPVGFLQQPQFLNLVMAISTTLEPLQLLDLTQQIEIQTGRIKTFRWGPRIIDIDILDYSNRTIENPNLKLPHDQLHVRKFVLIPLFEIANQYFHPVLHKHIGQLLTECQDKSRLQWYMNGNKLLIDET